MIRKISFLLFFISLSTVMFSQKTTVFSIFVRVDNEVVSDQIESMLIVSNSTENKSIKIVKSDNQFFKTEAIPNNNKTHLFIMYKKTPYYLCDFSMFDMKYLNNPQKDTLFLEFYYYSNPTEGTKWACRRNEEKIQGDASLYFKNEHLLYSYPIFNRKKYFQQNRKFIKNTKKGKDYKLEIKMCKF